MGPPPARPAAARPPRWRGARARRRTRGASVRPRARRPWWRWCRSRCRNPVRAVSCRGNRPARGFREPPSSDRKEAAESLAMSLRKVLLVDDEPDIRRIAQISLARVGKLEVILATSGAEALALAPRERPDVILL